MKTLLEIFHPEETMNIKKLRKQKGWSQKDLAEKIGMTRENLNRIETGKGKLTKTVRLAIERVVNM